MKMHVLSGLGTVVLAALWLGCANDEKAPARYPSDQATQTQTTNASYVAPTDTTTPKTQSSALEPAPTPFSDSAPVATNATGDRIIASDQAPLSDAEILDVLLTANNGELLVAEYALRRVMTPEVKQFAAMMKSQHEGALQKTKSVQARAKLDPASNDVSKFLKKDGEDTLKVLHDKDGIALDRAYMSSQVQAHRIVLATIDQRLAPSAKNGEMKSLLGDMRRTVASHLTHAEEVQQKVEGIAKTETVQRQRAEQHSQIGLGIAEPKDPMPPPAEGKQPQSKQMP